VIETGASKAQLRRGIGKLSLIPLGIGGSIAGAIIYGAQKAVATAGPAGLLAYAIAPFLYMTIALTYIDIAMDFPEAGGPSRFAIYSHGQATNLINSMSDLIWYLFIPPLEVYVFIGLVVHYFMPSVLTASGNLSLLGGVMAVAVILLFVPINYFGIRAFTGIGDAVGWLKVALYVLMALFFIWVGLSKNPDSVKNFSSYGGFMPYGVAGLFGAMPIVMFSFGGARWVADFAEELKEKRYILYGILITVIGEAVIYLTFTLAFILNVNWSALGIAAGDWTGLLSLLQLPYYAMASSYHVPLMAYLILIYLTLAPIMVGFVYMGGGARVMLSMGRSGYLNKEVKDIHPKYGVPYWSIILFGLIGAVVSFLFAPVPGLYALINDTVSAGFIGFLANPVAMMVLRKQGMSKYQVPGGWFVSLVAFGISSLIVFWSGWPAVPYSVLLIAVASAIFGIMYRIREGWREGLWYVGLIAFLTFMTYVGSDGALRVIPYMWATAITAAVSVAVFYPLGLVSGLKERSYKAHLGESGAPSTFGEGRKAAPRDAQARAPGERDQGIGRKCAS